jgi:hypothetical protein
MHPVMTEILAAERIREMVARGDGAQRARQARQARAARQARQMRAAHRSGLESQENHGRSSAPGRPGPRR